jgi:hypothetical protein
MGIPPFSTRILPRLKEIAKTRNCLTGRGIFPKSKTTEQSEIILTNTALVQIIIAAYFFALPWKTRTRRSWEFATEAKGNRINGIGFIIIDYWYSMGANLLRATG